jgi:hypothetical protein
MAAGRRHAGDIRIEICGYERRKRRFHASVMLTDDVSKLAVSRHSEERCGPSTLPPSLLGNKPNPRQC